MASEGGTPSQLTSAKVEELGDWRSEPLARKGEILKVLAKPCGGAPPTLLRALERHLVRRQISFNCPMDPRTASSAGSARRTRAGRIADDDFLVGRVLLGPRLRAPP
jgi:hypothetical protein